MTCLDVYVCDLTSAKTAADSAVNPFDWPRKTTSPFFPPLTPNAYWRVRDLIRQEAVPGQQVSQLEWCAYVTKADLARYLEEWYGPNETYGPNSTMPWLRDRLDTLREFIMALDDAGEYALVADEF
jgi:hypothetical protein